MISNHIIKQQIIDVLVPDQQSATEIQEELSRVYRNHVIPKLSDLFDELDVRGALQIDSLEVDIGYLQQSDIKEDFPEKVRVAIEEELKKVVHATQVDRTVAFTASHQQIERKSTYQSFLDAFTHYLRFGTLPWNQQVDVMGFQELFHWLSEEDPSALTDVLLNELKHEQSIKRVSFQLNDAAKLKLLNLLIDKELNPITSLFKDVIKINGFNLTNVGQTSVEYGHWELFFRWVLNEGRGSHHTKDALDRLIQIIDKHWFQDTRGSKSTDGLVTKESDPFTRFFIRIKYAEKKGVTIKSSLLQNWMNALDFDQKFSDTDRKVVAKMKPDVEEENEFINTADPSVVNDGDPVAKGEQENASLAMDSKKQLTVLSLEIADVEEDFFNIKSLITNRLNSGSIIKKRYEKLSEAFGEVQEYLEKMSSDIEKRQRVQISEGNDDGLLPGIRKTRKELRSIRSRIFKLKEEFLTNGQEEPPTSNSVPEDELGQEKESTTLDKNQEKVLEDKSNQTTEKAPQVDHDSSVKDESSVSEDGLVKGSETNESWSATDDALSEGKEGVKTVFEEQHQIKKEGKPTKESEHIPSSDESLNKTPNEAPLADEPTKSKKGIDSSGEATNSEQKTTSKKEMDESQETHLAEDGSIQKKRDEIHVADEEEIFNKKPEKRSQEVAEKKEKEKVNQQRDHEQGVEPGFSDTPSKKEVDPIGSNLPGSDDNDDLFPDKEKGIPPTQRNTKKNRSDGSFDLPDQGEKKRANIEVSGDRDRKGTSSPLSSISPSNTNDGKESASSRRHPPIPMSRPRKILEEAFIQNAGLVLLWPYLSTLFKGMNWVTDTSFNSEEDQYRALHFLQYLVLEEEPYEESDLVLNKLLCGRYAEDPVPAQMIFTDEEKEEANNLLEVVIDNWTVLKNTSVNGLRETFLKKEGILKKDFNGWKLYVERSAIDILLERLPWGYSVIKLPWLDQMIYVEW